MSEYDNIGIPLKVLSGVDTNKPKSILVLSDGKATVEYYLGLFLGKLSLSGSDNLKSLQLLAQDLYYNLSQYDNPFFYNSAKDLLDNFSMKTLSELALKEQKYIEAGKILPHNALYGQLWVLMQEPTEANKQRFANFWGLTAKGLSGVANTLDQHRLAIYQSIKSKGLGGTDIGLNAGGGYSSASAIDIGAGWQPMYFSNIGSGSESVPGSVFTLDESLLNSSLYDTSDSPYAYSDDNGIGLDSASWSDNLFSAVDFGADGGIDVNTFSDFANDDGVGMTSDSWKHIFYNDTYQDMNFDNGFNYKSPFEDVLSDAYTDIGLNSYVNQGSKSDDSYGFSMSEDGWGLLRDSVKGAFSLAETFIGTEAKKEIARTADKYTKGYASKAGSEAIEYMNSGQVPNVSVDASTIRSGIDQGTAWLHNQAQKESRSLTDKLVVDALTDRPNVASPQTIVVPTPNSKPTQQQEQVTKGMSKTAMYGIGAIAVLGGGYMLMRNRGSQGLSGAKTKKTTKPKYKAMGFVE